MNKDFYRAFEERYYAPREVIKRLRRQYLPFVRPLVAVYPGAQSFDIGCGRGEWLELMDENGLKPYGVDLDAGMLQACKEHGLPGHQGDAVECLATLPDQSQAIVTAFHVVEHLSFEKLQILVAEALRVLKPGGLLIIETPNTENVRVATINFYLDPTHQRPIPQQLLLFLSEYYGFARTKNLRLQESKELFENNSPTLNDVLAGASPDYAVIAQKSAPAEMFALFDDVFNKEYGLSLNTLADRFDMRLQQAEVHATQAEVAAHQAEVRATRAEVTAHQAEVRATRAEVTVHQAEVRATQAEVTAHQAEAGLHDVYNSHSWQITAPLRWAGKGARWFVNGSAAWLTLTPMSRPRRIARQSVIHLNMFFYSHPRLKAFALRWLAPFPGLKAWLKMVGHQPLPKSRSLTIGGQEYLTPHARRIYADLKAVIERSGQKENG